MGGLPLKFFELPCAGCPELTFLAEHGPGPRTTVAVMHTDGFVCAQILMRIITMTMMVMIIIRINSGEILRRDVRGDAASAGASLCLQEKVKH